ncbi:hypothetical protein RJT34_17260 [Clitoria ternatea]|uniref:Uncharacterized protein n=1 Tax=Clitoria ternatea TaxID=43366 RepID=A0AAN9J9Y1_CLITE
MLGAALDNAAVRMYEWDPHSYKYNSVKICLPGSSVPNMFTYRTFSRLLTTIAEMEINPPLEGCQSTKKTFSSIPLLQQPRSMKISSSVERLPAASSISKSLSFKNCSKFQCLPETSILLTVASTSKLFAA